MTNEIYIYEKPNLIKAMLDIKRGLHKITNYFIKLKDVGLKENPDLLFKILSHSDGLCKINYQHEECVYTCIKENPTEEDLFNNISLTQLDSNMNGSNSYTATVNSQYYDWRTFIMKYEDGTKVYETLKELSYYISPVGDHTRFINMLRNRVTILEKVDDFINLKIPNCIHPDDLDLSTYQYIYVLKPQQKEALNILANILEKAEGDIGYYIFIFKCGKTWFTLSKHKEVSIGYYTGQVLNINGVHYDFSKIKEVLENVNNDNAD